MYLIFYILIVQLRAFLTATTLTLTIGAGITAAAGTRLALQLFLVNLFEIISFQTYYQIDNTLIFFVATSTNCYWVIYAPAAILGHSRHFSCALSGIQP